MTAGDEGDQGNGRLRVRVKQGKDDGSISGSVPGTALPLLALAANASPGAGVSGLWE